MKFESKYIFSLIFIALLRRPLSLLISDSILNLTDELLLISILLLELVRILKTGKVKLFIVSYALLYVYMTIISLLFGYNHNIVHILVQNLIHIKFFVLFGYIYYRKDVIIPYFLKNTKFFIYILFIGFVLSLIYKQKMAMYIGMIPDFTSTDFKYSGFVKANILYLTIFFVYLYKTQIHFYYQNHKKIVLNTLIALSTLLFLGSRTTLLAIAIVLMINYSKILIKLITRKAFLIVVFLGFIVLNYATPLVSRTLTNFQDSFDLTSHYIRGIMMHLSVLIAKRCFPIGSGSGTFGTVFSEGSPVYDFYNQGWRTYFTRMVGIFDSNFASVLGEFGVIGLILFAIMIVVMLKKLKILVNKKMYYVLAFLLWFNFFFRGLFMSSDLTFLILLSFFFIIYNYEKNINSNQHVS